MRLLLQLGLVVIIAGCKRAPGPPAPTPSPTVIEPEPIASSNDYSFKGCDFDPDPVLAVIANEVLLDGSPEDDAGLLKALNDKQALYAVLGAPAHRNLVLEVAVGVPEKRVAHVLAIARAAGFVDVTRLPDLEVHQARGTKPRRLAHEGPAP